MGSLDEDPVFELVNPNPKTEEGQDATGEQESEEYLDAQDGTDRVGG